MKRLVTAIKKYFKQLTNNEGFSLLEIMIVITIMGILIATVGPKLWSLPDKARVTKTKDSIANVKSILSMYRLDNGKYPSTEQGLQALIEQPSSEPVPTNYREGGYIDGNKLPKDAWGNDFIYSSPGEEGRDLEIISLGADGQEGGEGTDADITSWE